MRSRPRSTTHRGLNGPYLLEVSSPGLERPLRTPEHFAGAIGQTVSISHHTDAGPRRRTRRLVDAGERRLLVEVDGEREEIAYDAITKAHTVFEWGPAPRQRAKRRTRGRAKEQA